MQALLGTRLSADINLAAQLLILIGLWVGYYFARTRQIPKHRNTQTTLVLVNLFFIAFVMATSFYNYVISGRTITGTVALLMMVHGALGSVAQISGIYLILRMRTQLVPPRLRVRNFKLMMRATLTLWSAIVVLGIGIYYYRYVAPKDVAMGVPAPLAQFRQHGADVVVHALELQEAVQRGNLETAKRHAEHLVNLIEGKTGKNYGDLDKDGTIEDPGDGTGLLQYLQSVADAAGPELRPLAHTLRRWLAKLKEDSRAVLGANDLGVATRFAGDAVSVAQNVNSEGVLKAVSRATELGVAAARSPTIEVPAPSAQPATITLVMDKFQFIEKTVLIRSGWTVVWVNKEAPRHTTTSDDGKFNSGTMPLGTTFSFTFNEAGTFPYYCRFHGDKGGIAMAGTVVVQP
jgi:plastocyanin/uncharacterized membrane protein YozB (DUF420 family)